MHAAYEQLIEQVDAKSRSWKESAFELPEPSLPKTELLPQPIKAADLWHAFDAEREIDRLADPDLRDQQMTDVGRQFNLAVGHQQLSQDPPAWQQVSKIWAFVRRHPKHIYDAARALERRFQSLDLRRTQRPAAETWDQLCILRSRQKSFEQELREGAHQLELAQRSYTE